MPDAQDIIHLIQPGWTGVEVGVAEGYSSVLFLEKGCYMYLVDMWAVYEGLDNPSDAGIMRQCLDRINPWMNQWTVLRASSSDAARYVPEVDFTWIDGNHRYEWVKADLENYWPKVKAGGVFAGHDYTNSGTCEVRRAVDEFAAARGLKVETSGGSWFVRK
jgi:hypothetical protein